MTTDSLPTDSTPAEPLPSEDVRRRRLSYRAWHRGTREADYMVGGFFDMHQANWQDAELSWFEALIDEQDVDIMAWAIGTTPPPARYAGPLMEAMRRLDYINVPR
jgi:antitoxin CptB